MDRDQDCRLISPSMPSLSASTMADWSSGIFFRAALLSALGLYPVMCSSELTATKLTAPSPGSVSGALMRLRFPAKVRRKQPLFHFQVLVQRTGLRWLKRSR